MTELLQAHRDFSAILASFAVSWRLALARANEEAARLRNAASELAANAADKPSEFATTYAAMREKIIRKRRWPAH